MKKIIWTTAFVISFVFIVASCKKNKANINSLVGEWNLEQIFLGYTNGGDFIWKKSPEEYYYNIKAIDSIYTNRYVSCNKGVYSTNLNTIIMSFDCGNSSFLKDTLTYSFINNDSLIFHKIVDDGYIEYKFSKKY